MHSCCMLIVVFVICFQAKEARIPASQVISLWIIRSKQNIWKNRDIVGAGGALPFEEMSVLALSQLHENLVTSTVHDVLWDSFMERFAS